MRFSFGQHTSAIPPENLPSIALLGDFAASFVILGAVWSKTFRGFVLMPNE